MKVDSALRGFGGEVGRSLDDARNVFGVGWGQSCGAHVDLLLKIKFSPGFAPGVGLLRRQFFLGGKNKTHPQCAGWAGNFQLPTRRRTTTTAGTARHQANSHGDRIRRAGGSVKRVPPLESIFAASLN